MEGLVKLAARVLAELAFSPQRSRHPPHILAAMACGLVAIPAVLGVIGCLVAALWVALSPQIGPVGAPLACAGALFLFCGVLALLAMLFLRRRDPPVAAGAGLLDLLQHLEGRHLFRENKLNVLLGALVAGLVMGIAGSKRTGTNRH